MNARKITLLLAAAVVFPAMAQSRPMPPDPYDPHQSQPTQQNNAPAVYPANNDFPSVEVQAVAPARARMVEMRWTMDLARRSLHRLVDQLREDFEYSAAMQAALRANKAAHDRFTAAREAALTDLKRDARYSTLRSMSDDLRKRIDELKKQDPKANADAILGAAELRLFYASQASDLEMNALAANSDFQNARAALRDSAQQLQTMREQFNRSLKRSEEFVSARDKVETLNIAYLGADAYFLEAVRARDIALNYAAWIRRYDNHKYRVSFGFPWNPCSFYPSGRYYRDSLVYYRPR